MSFDKPKAMRSAERFLSQGKIRAAITEYKRIVENDPRDFTTLNILGDLYVKSNDETAALGCFTQVAEHYSKQGFAQKAIAIYNKIARLQPNSLEISAKLAHLYKLKGSFVEAREHFVAVAEHYQRMGDKAQALEIWKQVAQLDPNNTEVYLKIAEFCLEAEQKDEAARALTEAGIRLANQNHAESALAAFTKALELNPFDIVALNGFVKAQLKLGNADEAAETLEKILEQQPYNREILYLLADCYLDMNSPAEAERVVVKLVQQEPANHLKFLHVVEVYVKNDDLGSAVQVLANTADHLLVSSKSEDFVRWLNEILARDPEQIEALRLMVRYHSWQRDESELKNALVRLAEAARLQNNTEEEKHALSQLVVIVPHEEIFTSRLRELGGEPIATENVSVAEAAAGAAHSFQPHEAEVPSFETFAVLNNEIENAGNEQLFLDSFHEINDEIGVSDDNESFQVGAADFEQSPWANLEQTEWSNASDDYAADKQFEIASDQFTLNDGTPIGTETPLPSFEFDSAPAAGLSLSDEHRLGQEIEGIEFYINEGYLELAETALGSLEAEFGPRDEFAELRRRITQAQQAPAEENAAFPADYFNFQPTPEMSLDAVVEKHDCSAGSDFLEDFRTELGLEEISSNDEGDYETHYHMAIAYKEMGLMEEAIKEFQDAVKLVRPDDGTRRFFQCCILLGHCFMERGMPNPALVWFRRAPETPGLDEEEQQAVLYEIANAYETGGEVPKALECFEQIYALNVDYRDVSQRLETLRAHHMVV